MLTNEVTLNIYLLAIYSWFIGFYWIRFPGKNDFEGYRQKLRNSKGKS